VFSSVQLLWWLSVVAESALLFTLFVRKLYRTYIFFSAYIAADVCVSLGMMWLVPDTRSKAYARVWSITEPALVLLQLAFALELYLLISRHYRNFERMRPRLFWSCLLPSLAVSLLVLFIDMPAQWKSPWVQGIFLGKRVAAFALAAFIVAITLFIRMFPIPMRANVTAHRRIAAVYFLSSASLYFAMNFSLHVSNALDLVLMSLTGGCFLAWIVLLKPRGEAVETLPEPGSAEIEAHVQRGEELVRRVGSLRP
jgi:cytochrome bd-type quinol oxidase subunit 2